jgi:diguanylate cyclase (GGDEF)-like protein
LSQAANRPRDFIARIGGEEFVWLLPETDAASARQVARRCLHLIRQQQIEHGFSAVSNLLTLSLGVGTRTVTPDQPMLEFVEAVDKLLYQAKRNGRMRAEFAGDEV